MYIVSDNIFRVFWEVSKTSDFADVKSDLNKALTEYTGWDWVELANDRELADLAVDAFAEYCESDQVKSYQIRDLFKYIMGDKVIESIYGKDTISIEDKVIIKIMGLFRLSQIYSDKEHEMLIDYGQTKNSKRK